MNDPVLTIHRNLFVAGLLISLVVGVWGIVTYLRKRMASGALRSTLVLTALLFTVQGAIGLVLFFTGHPLRDKLHFLYGVLLVLALPIAASYVSQNRRREPLIYGIVGLIMAALAIRAFSTGGG
ncbi:MAG TPA: hypothetical protein VET65_06890 [Candidatus Limnocylindrales bacterium]|nr:hypothetical protein [Candidatus Limnocylindrales bacterium]